MELGAFNFQAGHFEGPYLLDSDQRIDSDLALRMFMEHHMGHPLIYIQEDVHQFVASGYREVKPVEPFCMKFLIDVTEPSVFIYDKFSNDFGKVLFIVDIYGWAWDIASRELLAAMPDVDGTVVDLMDFRKMEFNPAEWDMVLVYPWVHRDVMDRLDPRNTVVCVAGGEQLDMMPKFKRNCSRFMVIGACNKKIQRFMEKMFPMKKVMVLSHGVDTEKFRPEPVPHREFTVGWVGATQRDIKRFGFAKEICEEAGLPLKVAGRGPDATLYSHDEMPGFYNSVDVLLVTSMFEAHSLVVPEAMACGLPVISTNVGDLSEYVVNGVNGFIFDPCCEKDKMPKTLQMLRDNPDTAKKMGEEGRRTVLNMWRWENISNQYRALGRTRKSDTSSPRVSVITATKNRAHLLRRCLDSVLQEGYGNLELIVVDSASKDGTVEILEEYRQKHGVKYVSEPDRSQGDGRNKGLEMATGDFVTFLDSDDQMISGELTILSEFLQNNDKYFAAFGNTIFVTPENIIHASNRGSMPSEPSFETLLKSNYIGCGAIMLRNTPEVRFDPDIKFGEDHMLWLDLIAKYPFAYLDFDAYKYMSSSPDGIGQNLKDWRKHVNVNIQNAQKRLSSGSRGTKMRIAVFCDAYGMHPYGGPAVYGYNICETLYRGRNEFVMFYNPVPNWHPHPDYYRRKEHLLPRPSRVNVDDFDVFYVMNSPKAIQMLNHLGVEPIIGSNHITNSAADHCLPFLDEETLSHRGHLVEHEKAFLRNNRGKFWFAQSRFQIREYQRVGMDLDKTRAYLAYNPTDTDLFKRKGDYGEYVMWSGKNNWAKGVPFLMDVVKSLPEQKFRCLWGGEGDSFPMMPSNAELTIGGTLFSVPPHLEDSKLFLTTSVTENQPCAALEAMSMELPVVGFNTSGMPEIVEDGVTGFLVELGDSKAMTEKVKLLLEDESLRRQMGLEGRKRVMEKYSYYATLDQYLDYFKMYVGG